MLEVLIALLWILWLIVYNIVFYIFFPDVVAISVVLYFKVPIWLCYMLVALHSMAWIGLKTFAAARWVLPWIRRPTIAPLRPPQLKWSSLPQLGAGMLFCLRMLRHWIKIGMVKTLAWLEQQKVSHKFFFWCGLEPQGQKAGCLALGDLWQEYGFRGYFMMATGGAIQVTLYFTLLLQFGEKFANRGVYYLLLPFAAYALLSWLYRKYRKPH